MRLIFAVLGMVLALGATAVARPIEPEPGASTQPAVTTDLRAPDQVAPMQPSVTGPVTGPDLRAPDQVAPMQPSVTGPDLRAPDQVAPMQPSGADLRAPDQVAGPTPSVPTPVADGGLAAIVFVLIGLGAALVLLAGGYLGVRYRHRVAIADDPVVH
jgi:hypothetical protein